MFSLFFYKLIIDLLFMGISKKLNALVLDVVLDNFMKASIEITLSKYLQPFAV